MKKILTIFIALIGVFVIGNHALALSFGSGWTRGIPLNINYTKVGGTSNLTNYPVLLTEANFNSEIFTKAKSDGCDLRFTSDLAGTTELASEKVSFNTGASTLEWYVNVASISYTATTTIYAWYGNSAASCYNATDTYGRNNTWNSSYKAVYHMNDNPDTSHVIDSTSNSSNGTKTGAGTPGTATGKVGEAQNFATNNKISLPNDIWDAVGSGSIQAWLKPTSMPVTAYHWIGGGSGASDFFMLGMSTAGKIYCQKYSNDAYIAATSISTGNWGHVCWKSNGSAWSAYMNGGSAETLTQLAGSNSGKWFAAASTGTTLYMLGNSPYASYGYYGVLDEIRISTTQFTQGWNTTDYNNQNSPSTFVIEGTPFDVTTANPAYLNIQGGNVNINGGTVLIK